MVRLDCLVKLKYDALGPCTFILNVEPAVSQHQTIVHEDLVITGAQGDLEREINGEGTRLVRFIGNGPVEISSHFVVDIMHHMHPVEGLNEMAPADLPLHVLPYTLPSRYCESDKLMPFAQQQFGWMQPGYQRVAAISKWVQDNVDFRTGTSGWQTSASDILNQRQGVCRDFAHLMIAICRALNIPARFATGIDYGADPQLGPVDFHAYVEVFLSGRWYLFDPTGISPTTGLVRLGTGRDASEVSFATIFGSVSSWAPYLEVSALVDPAKNIVLPERTHLPVSTAEAIAL